MEHLSYDILYKIFAHCNDLTRYRFAITCADLHSLLLSEGLLGHYDLLLFMMYNAVCKFNHVTVDLRKYANDEKYPSTPSTRNKFAMATLCDVRYCFNIIQPQKLILYVNDVAQICTFPGMFTHIHHMTVTRITYDGIKFIEKNLPHVERIIIYSKNVDHLRMFYNSDCVLGLPVDCNDTKIIVAIHDKILYPVDSDYNDNYGKTFRITKTYTDYITTKLPIIRSGTCPITVSFSKYTEADQVIDILKLLKDNPNITTRRIFFRADVHYDNLLQIMSMASKNTFWCIIIGFHISIESILPAILNMKYLNYIIYLGTQSDTKYVSKPTIFIWDGLMRIQNAAVLGCYLYVYQDGDNKGTIIRMVSAKEQ